MLLKKILPICLICVFIIVLSSSSFAINNFEPENDINTVISEEVIEAQSKETEEIITESEEIITEEPTEEVVEPTEEVVEPTEEVVEPTEEVEEPIITEEVFDGIDLSQLTIIYSELNTPWSIGFYGTEKPYLIIINVCGYVFSSYTHPEKFDFVQNGDMTDVYIDTHRDNGDGTKTAFIGGYSQIYIVGENFTVDGYCWLYKNEIPTEMMEFVPQTLTPLY